MENVETITCDYPGCTKTFAYRVKGFNLCAEHVFRPDEIKEWAEKLSRFLAATAKEKNQ